MTAIQQKNPTPPPEPFKIARSGPAFKKFECVFLDFETESIERRPQYPPQPVSYSIKWSTRDRKPRFRSWGHPVEYGGNNCSYEQAKDELVDVWRSGMPIVCQHGKFDLEVAERHFGLPIPDWRLCHDTEFLIFLENPHANTFSLKPSAERILGIKPEERDILKEWVLANIKGATQKEWGAHISKCPAELVGPYANGDITRTEKLFYHLMKHVHDTDMVAAYNRERRVMPIFLRNEQTGIRLDADKLERDMTEQVAGQYLNYMAAMEFADNWIRKKLKAPDLNIDTDKDYGEALFKADAISQWTWTKGGKNRPPQRSVAKGNLLIEHYSDRRLALVYGYRNRLATCIRMFMTPWLEYQQNGYVNTNWNQVRGGDYKSISGTRSGRPSTNDPNLLAISKSFMDKDDGYEHPAFLPQLPPLPLVREYLLPDKGECWGHRDYNQQELRMVAHFENGGLMENYCRKPWRRDDGEMNFDIHSSVQHGIEELIGIALARRSVKVVNFSDIYGKGLANLAEDLGVDVATVGKIRKAKNKLMPGVADLIDEVKSRGGRGEPIRTWGGRLYYAEPPSFSKKFNRVMDFTYKLFNYLIQPSSADVTKEALIRYDAHPQRRGRFLVTVYDEVNASMPQGKAGRNHEMRVLRESMESIECDVPMLSDGKTGPNWGSIKGCYKELKCEQEEWVVGQPWW